MSGNGCFLPTSCVLRQKGTLSLRALLPLPPPSSLPINASHAHAAPLSQHPSSNIHGNIWRIAWGKIQYRQKEMEEVEEREW